MKNLMSSIFILFLCLQIKAEEPSSLSLKPFSFEQAQTVFPNRGLIELWQERPYEVDEFWRFKDLNDFNSFLDSQNLTREQRELLRKSLIPNNDKIKRSAVFMNLNVLKLKANTILELSEKQLSELPEDIVSNLYNHQYQSLKKYPTAYKSEDSLATLEAILNEEVEDLNDRKALKAKIVKIGDKYVIPHSPNIWPHLPRFEKFNFIQKRVESTVKVGNNLNESPVIVINKKDINQVVEKYRGARDPKEFKKRILELLGGKDSKRVSLIELFPKFVRDTVGTFSTCHGPNCVNAARNASFDKLYDVDHDLLDSNYIDLVKNDHRYVDPSEALRPGDKLLYYNGSRSMDHGVFYLGDDYVYTKNGLSRYSGYVVQKKDHVEKLYYDPGKFNMVVIREVDDPSQAIANLKNLYSPKFYYAHPSTIYQSVGIDLARGQYELEKQISELRTSEPSFFKLQMIEEMINDPRLSSYHDRLNYYRELMKSHFDNIYYFDKIGFSPLGRPGKNVQNIKDLIRLDSLSDEQIKALKLIEGDKNLISLYSSAVIEVMKKHKIKLPTKACLINKISEYSN